MAVKKPKKRSRLKEAEIESKLREIVAPHPEKAARAAGRHFLGNMKVAAVIIILAVIISMALFIAAGWISGRSAEKKRLLGYEQAIDGTQIQLTKETIEQLVASGTPAIPKDTVLSGGNDYICTIMTDKGIITLKKRGSMMREEAVRDGYRTTVLYLDDNYYLYNDMINVWAMFPYDPEEDTANSPVTKMAFSMMNLRQINETGYLCIGTELPDSEFSLGDTEVVDALDAMRGMRFLR